MEGSAVPLSDTLIHSPLFVYADWGDREPVPLDLESATQIAEEYVRGFDFPTVLFRSETVERDFGWVFLYGPADPSILVAGSAPLIVDRNDGTVHATGTAYPMEMYIESYERIGRAYPFAVEEHLVILDGWKAGMQKMLLTKLIHQTAHRRLSEAKHCTDELLAGRTVTLVLSTAAEADALHAEMSLSGVCSRRETRFR